MMPWWNPQNPGAPQSNLMSPVASPWAPYGGYHPIQFMGGMPQPGNAPAMPPEGMPQGVPTLPGAMPPTTAPSMRAPLTSGLARPTPGFRLPSTDMPPTNFQVPGRFAFPSLHALL